MDVVVQTTYSFAKGNDIDLAMSEKIATLSVEHIHTMF